MGGGDGFGRVRQARPGKERSARLGRAWQASYGLSGQGRFRFVVARQARTGSDGRVWLVEAGKAG